MKHIAIAYMVIITLFNLSQGSDFWRFTYHFTIHATLFIAFYVLRKKEFKERGRSRFVYLTLMIYEGFYILYQFLCFTSKKVYDYLGIIDQKLWSGIVVILVIILLLSNLKYDWNAKRSGER